MSFLEPHRLWFLLVVPGLLVAYILLQRRKNIYALSFTNMALLDAVVPSRVSWRRHLAVGLALLTLAFGIVLLAQPSKVVRVPASVKSHFTVVLALDVSLSMAATDVAPSRIVAGEVAAKQFVAQLPPNFEAGLVLFAGKATLAVAPTTDRSAVTKALDGLKLGERTATGEGVYTSLDVIKQQLGQTHTDVSAHVPALIVMISDGYRTSGRDQNDAARAAKAQGVPIYTVAVGTPSGVVTAQGQMVGVPVKVDELEEISRISGGKSYVASTPDDLLDAYHAVGEQLVYTTQRRDNTSDYLPFLVLLTLLSTAVGLFAAPRWP